MATYLEARNLLAPYVDNGVAVTDTTRIDQRIDEAQRRLIDHYNFLSRREELEKSPLVWQKGGTTGVPTTGDLILDNLDATKTMILSLWREENNQLELATALETKANSYIERNLMNEVERARRTTFQSLATSNGQNTFGGMTGRIGLETLVQYRLPESRLKSYINQAYQQAVDHYNFVSRREDKAKTSLTFAALTSDAAQFDSLLPVEVVRLLALSIIAADNGADGAGLKTQALELIDRNVTADVERTRRGQSGEEGRLHNELPDGVKIPTARMTQYLSQAASDASLHYDFLARREDYSTGIKPNPFTFEVRKKLVESYIATANAAAEVAASLKQEAFALIERDLMDDVETVRRAAGGTEGQLHNELPEGVKIPTARLTTYLTQAQTEASAHYSFLSRREDYAGGTTPSPFPYEVRKKLVESYLATTSGAADAASALKQEALALVERNLMQEIEAARRVVGGEAGRLHNELPEGVKIPTSRMNEYLTQSATDAGAHWDFLARREDYSSGTKPNPFAFEVRKKLVESYVATATAAPDVAASLKQEAFAIIERDLMAQVEAARRAAAGEEGKLHNELPEGVKISTARMTTYLAQAATEAGAHWDFLARREDYSSGTKPNPFSYEVRKSLVESYVAGATGAVDVATAKKQEALAVIERDLMAQVEAARRAAAGEEGRLHNELTNGVAISTTRLTQHLAQAALDASAHYDFLARREDYFGGTKPNPFPFEVRKKLVESYVAATNAAPDVAAALKTEAQAVIERDLMFEIEAARRGEAGEEGRLHNELPEGVKVATSRLTTYLGQAATEAGTHWDFLARREDYSSGVKPSPFSYEIRKKFIESYVATANAAPDVAASIKAEAQALIERDLMADVEDARAKAAGTEGRLHNELPEGVKVPTARLTTYLSQAATEAGTHWDFLARREDYSSGTKPNPFTYEVLKLLVESYLATSNAAVDVAAAKKQEAFAVIERDLMADVEEVRGGVGGEAGRLHNELPEGVKIPTARINEYLTQAQTDAQAHYQFLARREDYSGAAIPNPFAFDIRKKLVESYVATANAAPEVAAALKEEAFATIEKLLMAQVESARASASGDEGKLHNELPDGVKISTARLTTYLSQAATEAGAHWDFLARREDYSSGTKPTPFAYEVLKKFVESYIATANAAPDVATALKQEAFSLIERDLMRDVENTRRQVANDEGKLHNELPDGVKIPTARLTVYLSQANTEAGAHWDFLARREDYSSGTKPATFSFEVRKKLVESYIATATASPDVAAALKQEAFATIERDLMTQVEATRRAAAGDEGRLHNELPEGVKFPTARLTTYLTQAGTDAGAHYDFLARREDYAGGTKPNPFPFEIRKKLVESYIATASGAPDISEKLKEEAFALVERDLVRSIESTRRQAAGDEGRLHNELADGVKIPTARLTTHLSQATTEIGAQQAFLQRREDYNGAVPTPTYEQRKLLVESYIATSSGQSDVAAALKQQAFALIERDVMQSIENTRRATREALLVSANDTFGYHWGRIGLELPEAYKLSDSAIKRMVNAAEEQLMLAGKWVGTVAEYTLSVNATGEFFLPAEVETILYMSFDGDPKPVHDRLNEWIKGGTGYRETDDAWREGAVDRGESIDPSDNVLKRKYWITLPVTGSQPVVRILAKRRFVPHSVNSEKMYLRNYQAIYEATKGILLGGEQITPHIDKAKEMLSGQIAQQNFTGNRGAAHTRRVLMFR